jgi:putative flippase GtrA
VARRIFGFVAVGAAGFAVQICTLAYLVVELGWPYPLATLAAVETAVLHNFGWHERWTWADRSIGREPMMARLARFHAANGAMSIAGNLLITTLLVEGLGLNAIAANTVSVLLTSTVNFLAADRWVFAG